MVEVRCDDCDELMDVVDSDSRQEWFNEIYQCKKCDKKKLHRMTFNQIGLITEDVIEEYKD